jgi:hypothetical protein
MKIYAVRAAGWYNHTILIFLDASFCSLICLFSILVDVMRHQNSSSEHGLQAPLNYGMCYPRSARQIVKRGSTDANREQSSTSNVTFVRNTGFTVLYEPAAPKEAIVECYSRYFHVRMCATNCAI